MFGDALPLELAFHVREWKQTIASSISSQLLINKFRFYPS